VPEKTSLRSWSGYFKARNSVAILGALVNIGKLKPDLFCGVLKPLAASQHLHRWDENLVESLPTHFNGMQLAPLGELIFGIGSDWHFALNIKPT